MSVSPHVLIVDDDAEVRQLVADYLGDFDLRVSGAAYSSGMRCMLPQSFVDLILLDGKLPAEDATTIARKLRLNSSISIIMRTRPKDQVARHPG